MALPVDSGNGGGAGAPTGSGGLPPWPTGLAGPQEPGARRRDIVARRVVIDGHVQGVFFRDSCAREARGHTVAGWIRNRADGRVEAWFEGNAQAVEKLLAWCRQGPPHARVTGVDVSPVDPASLSAFRIE